MGGFYRGLDDGLTLYVRQLAYLATAPKPFREVPGAAKPRSRIEELKAAGVEPQLPPNPAPHIISRLMEIGPIEAAGMGRGPIAWQTIAAWKDATRARLSGWEARLLRRLSISYLNEAVAAEDFNRPAPWRTEPTAQQREAAERWKREMLGALRH